MVFFLLLKVHEFCVIHGYRMLCYSDKVAMRFAK